jgi:hypothetical protein
MNQKLPVEVTELKPNKIKKVACGENYTLFLTG